MQVDYILEPSQEEIVEQLIPKNIKIQLYKAVLDSHASEHGARMTAMDKATDNAGELLKATEIILQPGTPGSHHHRAHRDRERCGGIVIKLIKTNLKYERLPGKGGLFVFTYCHSECSEESIARYFVIIFIMGYFSAADRY